MRGNAGRAVLPWSYSRDCAVSLHPRMMRAGICAVLWRWWNDLGMQCCLRMQQVLTDAVMSPAAEQNPLNPQTSSLIINCIAHFIHQLVPKAAVRLQSGNGILAPLKKEKRAWHGISMGQLVGSPGLSPQAEKHRPVWFTSSPRGFPVDSSCLEVFKAKLDKAWSNLGCGKVSLPRAGVGMG